MYRRYIVMYCTHVMIIIFDMQCHGNKTCYRRGKQACFLPASILRPCYAMYYICYIICYIPLSYVACNISHVHKYYVMLCYVISYNWHIVLNCCVTYYRVVVPAVLYGVLYNTCVTLHVTFYITLVCCVTNMLRLWYNSIILHTISYPKLSCNIL